MRELYQLPRAEAIDLLTKVDQEPDKLVSYFRRGAIMWISNDPEFFSHRRVLVFNYTKELFERDFYRGDVDSRLILYTDPEVFNMNLRMEAFRYGRQLAPSMFLEKPTLRLCGRNPSLWDTDSQIAHEKTMRLLQIWFPTYGITFQKADSDWME